MTNEAHWHYLPVYMHLNPVKAQMVAPAGQYLCSSHSVYVRKSRHANDKATSVGQAQSVQNTKFRLEGIGLETGTGTFKEQ